MRSKKYKKSKNIFDVDDEIDYSLWGGRNPYEIALRSGGNRNEEREKETHARGVGYGYGLNDHIVIGRGPEQQPFINVKNKSDIWNSDDPKITNPLRAASYNIFYKDEINKIDQKGKELLNRLLASNTNTEINKINNKIEKNARRVEGIKPFDDNYKLDKQTKSVINIDDPTKISPIVLLDDINIINKKKYLEEIKNNKDPIDLINDLRTNEHLPKEARDLFQIHDFLYTPGEKQSNHLRDILKTKNLKPVLPKQSEIVKEITGKIEANQKSVKNKIDEKYNRKLDNDFIDELGNKPTKTELDKVKKQLFVDGNENPKAITKKVKPVFKSNSEPPDNDEVQLWINKYINDIYRQEQHIIDSMQDKKKKENEQKNIDNTKSEEIDNLVSLYKNDSEKFLKDHYIEKRSDLIKDSDFTRFKNEIKDLKYDAELKINQLKLNDNGYNQKRIINIKKKIQKYDDLIKQKPTIAIYNQYINKKKKYFNKKNK
jgi:hypothetical protein